MQPNLPMSHLQCMTATNIPISIRPQRQSRAHRLRADILAVKNTFIFPPNLPPSSTFPSVTVGEEHHSHPTLNIFLQVWTSVPTHTFIIQSLELLIFLFTRVSSNSTQTYSGIWYTKGCTLELTTHIVTFFHTK